MKTRNALKEALMCLLLLGLNSKTHAAIDDANTVLSVQGQLLIANQLDHGSNTADIVFTLFNTNSGGIPFAGPVTNFAVAVNSNGLFTTFPNFGSNVDNTHGYWMEISVRTNGGTVFATLSPRQPVTPAPQAYFAANAGVAAVAITATNFVGTVSGDVAGTQGATVVTSVGGQSAASIASGVAAANGATSASVPDSIVARDGSGNLNVGAITFAGHPHVPAMPVTSLSIDSSIYIPTNGTIYMPFPATIYSGTNTWLIEEGSTFAGLGAGFGAAVNSHDVGIGDYVLSSSPSGQFNTAVGELALQYNTTGSNNVAGGFGSLRNNTTGSGNKADGYETLYYNTNGSYNTANGYTALYANTSGTENSANGNAALFHNTTGNYNTASGSYAMASNLSGSDNTASGHQALNSNTSGNFNVASGSQALLQNTTGSQNTANGQQALENNTTGSFNTANGSQSLFSNTTGIQNTADGLWSLFSNTNGLSNTGIGYDSLYDNTSGSLNTAVGVHALINNTSGSNNIAVGTLSGDNLTTGNYNIDIGNEGAVGEGNTIRIGTTNIHTSAYVAGIWGTTLGGSPKSVVVDNSGHLGVTTSVGGVTQVTGSGDIIVSPTTGNVVVSSDATSFNNPNSIVRRDGNGDFSADNVNANNVNLGGTTGCSGQTGVLNLPATSATAGMITLGGCPMPFLHGYGSANFFGGLNSGNFTLTGNNNVGVGYVALENLTSGTDNTAVGASALFSNDAGYWNVANGSHALFSNTSGYRNTANGYLALYANTTGSFNTANGVGALTANMTGTANSANGDSALNENTIGSDNTANGVQALANNNTGNYNTADGTLALFGNVSGNNNTANGYQALGASVGNDNTADGYQALTGSTTGTNNIAVGSLAGQNLVTGNNNIYIGNQAEGENFSPDENNTIRIGPSESSYSNAPSTYIAGIYAANVSGCPVYVDASGHLGTLCSSARFKQNIQTMADASDVLLSLRPVKYQYKLGLDPKGIPQFGLVAEEVDKVDPDLVVHDQQHGIYTVRYEAVNAMLLNEFLKQHQKVEAQNREIECLKQKAAQVDSLESRLNELQALVKQLATQK